MCCHIFGTKRLDIEADYWYKIKPSTTSDGTGIKVTVWCYRGDYNELSLVHQFFKKPQTHMTYKFKTEDIEKAIERAKYHARKKWQKKETVNNALE